MNYRGKPFALCLTHDIDRTGDSYKYRVVTGLYQSIKQKRPGLLFKGLFGRNEETNFEYILQREREYNAKATWFILTKYGLKKNADYRLKDREIQKAIKLIQAAGHEIGLHVPVMDYTVENIKNELSKLDGLGVTGARMHHLRGKYEEITVLLAKAGLKYDSTFGLGAFPFGLGGYPAYGFRTFIPFKPAGLEDFHEVPLNIMDIQVTDLEEFKRKIRLLFPVLKRVHGVCVINWHNNRFNRTKYGDIYRDSFDILLEEGEKHGALMTSIGELLEIISLFQFPV